MPSRRAELSRLPPETARLAVPVGRRAPASGVTGARLRLVLETEPGEVPWRPRLGVELGDLVGRPATQEALRQAERAVRAAVERWMPGVQVREVRARAVSTLGTLEGGDRRDLPVAEAALTPLGASCSLALDLELSTPEGPLTLSASLAP